MMQELGCHQDQCRTDYALQALRQKHKVIGTSELYESERARDNGVESVKTHAHAAGLEDQT